MSGIECSREKPSLISMPMRYLAGKAATLSYGMFSFTMCHRSKKIPPLAASAPLARVSASASELMMLNGIISNAIRVPWASASRHRPAKRSMSLGIGHFWLLKSPTLMARAPSPAAASNSSFLVTSDWAFSAPSLNQPVRNSSSTWRMPLSARIFFMSASE